MYTMSRNNNPLNKFRSHRLQLFLELFDPDKNCKILDVGGSSETWLDTGLIKNVTLLNLTTPKKRDLKLGFQCMKANALKMDLIEDQSYDIAFSNSVIEHVGDFSIQKRFADEIKRVGKSYWVQTPSRYFPVEPHLQFPFSQFMSSKMEHWIALNWPYSNYRKWGVKSERISEFLGNTRLLTESEMRRLFPGSNIHKEKFFGMSKSFIAWKN